MSVPLIRVRPPRACYTHCYNYNHVHRLRLEKLLYLELSTVKSVSNLHVCACINAGVAV